MTIHRIAILATIAGVATGVAAQPFAHNIGEPRTARELANDAALLTGGDITTVGSIASEDNDFVPRGYIVVAGPGGVPLLSWITEDPDSQRDELLAAREDRDDKQLIVLQDGLVSVNPPMTDLVLFKIDPFSGALGYQWRYEGDSDRKNLGLELDGQTGLVAASVSNTAGDSRCTLLRFSNATGLPIFHNRYDPVNIAAFGMRFFDIAVDPDSGDIFAVGRVSVDIPGFTPESELLIARFTPAGLPVWFRGYELRVMNSDDAGPTEGAAVELTSDGAVAVTARIADPVFGEISAHVIVDRVAGAPLAAAGLNNPGASIQPAFSSLERMPTGELLVSGTADNAAGNRVPASWSIDASSGAFNWAWLPDAENGVGNSAIVQPARGPLLAGQISPNAGPIGDRPDVFLARTRFNGDGLCPVIPDFRQLQIMPVRFDIPVEARPLEQPAEAGLDVEAGEPVRRFVCESCPPDLAPPFGVLNFFDLVEFIGLYNAMDPAADLAAPSGVFNFFDITAYLAAFNAGCP